MCKCRIQKAFVNEYGNNHNLNMYNDFGYALQRKNVFPCNLHLSGNLLAIKKITLNDLKKDCISYHLLSLTTIEKSKINDSLLKNDFLTTENNA